MSQFTILSYFSFLEHIQLLEQFLAGRQEIVDRLELRLLNVRGKATARNGDHQLIADACDACFFEWPALPQHLRRLNGQLAAAHLADGFEPARQDGYSRELDPVELVLRACHHWDHDRWPGRNGRIVYAQSLYTVFILRQLEHLSVRIWDEGNDSAPERLQHVQRLLDLLNATVHAPLVRDARWLMQTAQGPLTRHLKPYFVTAGKLSESLTHRDRLEVHKAGASLAGGHLRSQLRHRSWQTGRAFDDPHVLAMTRSSSAMDMALLVRDLVPLLQAYSAACARGDSYERLGLADAILQGVSADPELLLTRLDLLAPSTMIEDLFVDRGEDGRARYTPMGQVHRKYLKQYGELIGHAAGSLQQDALSLDPAHAAYSPLGIVYGFCADLFSNMVLNTLRSPSSKNLSLEDMFSSRGRLEEKQTQAREWERLPKGEGEPDPFEHSAEWTEQINARMAGALEARAARPAEPNASSVPKACLYVVPRGVTLDSLIGGVLPAGVVSAQEHCLTSDVTRARATAATAFPTSRMLTDRIEGRFLASANSEGAWFGISKAALTTCTSQGKDALMMDVPQAAIDVLRLVCPELLVVTHQASPQIEPD